jgi:hypothetical protein
VNAERRLRGGDGDSGQRLAAAAPNGTTDVGQTDAPTPLFDVDDTGAIDYRTGPVSTPTAKDSATVLDHAEPWWRAEAERHLKSLASSGREFTVDDVRRLVTTAPADPNSWGGFMSGMAKLGHIRKAGYSKSTTAAGHGRVLLTWRGVA